MRKAYRPQAYFLGITLAGVLGLLAGSTPSSAQNLVPNGGFEERKGCPQPGDHFPAQYLKHWTAPAWQHRDGYTITQTPDYFHSCSEGKYSQPKNFIGREPALKGNGYVGLLLYKVQSREFIQVKLEQPLKADSTYYLKANLSMGDRAVQGIKSFAAKLTRDSAYYGNSDDYTPLKPLKGSPDQFFTKKQGWQAVSGCYRAKGGEQYLTLGNFQKDEEIGDTWVKKKAEERERLRRGYYYLDEVAVLPCSRIEDCPCSFLENHNLTATLDSIRNGEAGSTRLQLVNVYFKTDEAKLLEASYDMLYKLSSFLKENPDFQVVIEGHTDERGTAEYNRKLAKQRAKSVMEFLVSDGVQEQRFDFKAYGASEPIASNQTARGRRLNRRVEFILKRTP